MKLAYKIPHKVTCRMVGTMFAAICSCGQWSRVANPRARDNGLGVFLLLLPTVVEDLIVASHDHATSHVLDQHRLTRRVAA
jgi:hypothetical protein